MRVLFILFFLVFSPLMASAQQVQPQFTITVTNEQLNVIGKALGKLPYEEVFQTVGQINQQVQAQIAARQQKPWPETKPPEQPSNGDKE